MKTGDVYRWATDKAVGHEVRRKMHVYICFGNWQAEGLIFLFISKSDFNGGYRIEKSDGFDFLSLEHSFISLSNIVSYTTEELREYEIEKIGTVPDGHLKKLHAAVAESDIMEGWQIRLVCAALAPYL